MQDMKSEIKNIKISIDKLIAIQDLNLLNLFFTQFFSSFSYKTKEKEKLLMLKSFAKFLDNEKF